MQTRCAVVTGAASGIGAAVARHLIEAGWVVGLIDLPGATLQAAGAAMGDGGMVLAADVTDAAAVGAAFAAFAGRSGGRLDLLVNAAGLLYTGPFEDQAPADLARLLAVNNLGVALCCRAALPLLCASADAGGKPVVINLSSASAVVGIPSFAAYSASKFWVRGFTEALAMEWARRGIAVRSVLPPFVRTAMVAGREDNLFIKRLGVSIGPEAVVPAILAAMAGGPRHRPVTALFTAFTLLARFIPAPILRGGIALLGGYALRRRR